jgi:predicted Zn-dependent protease
MREIEFGRLLSEKIIQKYLVLHDEKATLYINNVGKSVALFAGRSDIEYHFAILDSETINAFAAPGGYVFITKGALLKMKNEAELAAVLAHEIGHINNKHILKELPPPRETGGIVNTLAALLVAQGTVVSSAFTEVVNQATEMLFSKGYKKDDEFEADRSAIFYVAETGYTPRGLFDFVKRMKDLQEKDEKAVVYNTHPSPTERLERIKKLIESEKFKLKKPDAEERFDKEIGHLKAGS